MIKNGKGVDLPVYYPDLTWLERKSARQQYMREQKNLCFHCKESLNKEAKKYINWDNFPNRFLDHPVHLQHDHKTGMTEGAVHNYCNAVMWQYENR